MPPRPAEALGSSPVQRRAGLGPRAGGAVSFVFFVMEGQWVSFFLIRFLFMVEKVVFLFYLIDFNFLFFLFFMELI